MISIDIHNLPDCLDKHKLISKNMYNMNLDIEFIYGSHFKNSKILRDFIGIIGQIVGLPEKHMARFILVIDELNNNAIEYGSDKCGKNMLRIKMINNGNSLDFNIEVEDNGKGKKHKNALEMETLRAHQLKLGYGSHESIRGRGLFMIIIKSVDRLYFKDAKTGGLIVGIKKNIKI